MFSRLFVSQNLLGLPEPLLVEVPDTILVNRAWRRKGSMSNPVNQLAWQHPKLPSYLSCCHLTGYLRPRHLISFYQFLTDYSGFVKGLLSDTIDNYE